MESDSWIYIYFFFPPQSKLKVAPIHCNNTFILQICIEMADSAGLAKVLENYQTFSPDSFEKGVLWYVHLPPTDFNCLSESLKEFCKN